jgi:pimeloyl-ACP methyl ester carboxylesterase
MTEGSRRAVLRETIVPFTAGDGLACNLVHVQGETAPTKGPVILVHGAGVRANIFRAPIPVTLVDDLIAHGYDVWLENWRASIDLPPTRWTLDQAAVFDHPAAVATVVRETGAEHVKAVVHCQGACSFVMSALAGLVPQVETIVTNAVSLHPIVPGGSKLKLYGILPAIRMMTDYLNPHWGLHAPTLAAKLVTLAGAVTHHGCDNAVCKQVSFTYGSGDPALWRHENLNDATHAWIAEEFGAVPVTFFVQMAKCVRRGSLVSVDGLRQLPEDFAAISPLTDARFAFFAGEKNKCFRATSQMRSYDHFNKMRKNYHSLRVLPGYSHLDVIFGKNSARDVFPLIREELDRPTARTPIRNARLASPARAALLAASATR